MKKVGLTGGIGSGKSTVARILETIGVEVYYSDARAKEILDSDPEVILAVRSLLGDEAYRDGKADRGYIASKSFSDIELLSGLNRIIHPAVREDYRKWAAEREGSAYTVMESAILIESGFETEVDVVVVVTAPEEVRIARCVKRDGTSEEEVIKRIRTQAPEKTLLAHADYVIHADDSRPLVQQVLDLDAKLRGRGSLQRKR